ncbi:MAG: LacI family DNA-binding transcriptional regulator [Oscillospiraceae bacterium]|nr:LacI family DNA-binding transcriptional regulator [Oscillospiraceae bacterium]
MATIKDVARLAGVSVSTISKYLNGGNVLEENAEAIRRAISELDYRVNPFARSLKTQRSKSIGILLPEITPPFFGKVVASLDRTFRENGYHCLISCYSSSHGLERDNLSYLLSNGIDGLIYAPEDLTADEYYELTANCSIPMVQMDRMIQGVESDTVLVNNADAVYQAVSQLIRKGHRRIAIITGLKSVYSAKERLVGYLRALSDNGILYDDNLVLSDRYEFATGYHACDQLMQLDDPPTAIVATNYDFTIGLVTAARERGFNIPDDLDIFGFDCVQICTMMNPPLPVVHQPEDEIGVTAATYLIQRLSGYTGAPRQTKLKCRLVEK